MRNVLKNLFVALFVIGILALVLGQILGQPVLLSYVETGSMKPAPDSGDGFVAVPQAITGSAEEGDVIVYQANELHGGGLTTHRIVGETDRGYITKGDANPFTDQDGKDEPPVKDAQIVAQAFQINGRVVVIPHLGDAVTSASGAFQTVQRTLESVLGTGAFLGTRGLAYLLFVVSLLYYILSGARGENKRQNDSHSHRERDTGPDVRLIVGAFTLLLLVGATLPMVLPAGTQQYGVVSAEFDSERPTVIPAGQSESLQQPLENSGRLPVVVYLEPASDGVDVQPRRTRLASGEQVDATVTLHAPDQAGYYRRFVSQHRYLAVLPRSTISTLHRVHPWAPIVVIDAVIGVPFYVFGVTLLGTGRIRNRSRTRDLSVLARLRRTVRSLY